MAPLITLLLGTVAARCIGWLGVGHVNSWIAATAVGLAAMFILTGFAHFAPALRRDLIAIVPPRLPAPGHLVTARGLSNYGHMLTNQKAANTPGATRFVSPVGDGSAWMCLL